VATHNFNESRIFGIASCQHHRYHHPPGRSARRTGSVGSGETGEVSDVSDQWSQFDSEQTNLESSATDESSANGVSPDYAIGVAEPLGEEAAATGGELTDDATSADEVLDQAPVSEAAADAPQAGSDDLAAATAADDGSAFLAELVRTMQATAGLERIRIAEAIERRRQERVDQIQARKASEADRMRVLAAEDMAAIEAWVDTETGRIKLERERRETAVREDLDLSLAEHASKIDQEIESIEAVLATYRAEVDAYFEGLDSETDPILIAQKAARRPVFPALEAVGEAVAAAPGDAGQAEPATADEPEVVGVMDPAAPTEPVESWAGSPEASTTPETEATAAAVESSVDVDQAGTAARTDEPVAVSDHPVTAAVGPTIGGAGALLQSIPAKRPMSWLRRSED
jgi:hypothetical protein